MVICMPLFGQVAPEEMSAALIGPVSVDGELALQIGYSKQILGLWLTGFGQFGETVEAAGEVTKLFQIWNQLYVGPVAGGGVDWSNQTGTGGVPTEAYIFGAGGLAVTYGFTDPVGAWGFYKFRTENKPKFGFGLYLLL